MMAAARLGAGPDWLVITNATALRKLGQRDRELHHLEEMYAVVRDPKVKGQIEIRLSQLRDRRLRGGVPKRERGVRASAHRTSSRTCRRPSISSWRTRSKRPSASQTRARLLPNRLRARRVPRPCLAAGPRLSLIEVALLLCLVRRRAGRVRSDVPPPGAHQQDQRGRGATSGDERPHRRLLRDLVGQWRAPVPAAERGSDTRCPDRRAGEGRLLRDRPSGPRELGGARLSARSADSVQLQLCAESSTAADSVGTRAQRRSPFAPRVTSTQTGVRSIVRAASDDRGRHLEARRPAARTQAHRVRSLR